jgi:dihydroorotase (multifunctional complex type)
MSVFDLSISGAKICTEEGLVEANLAIEDGVIAAISKLEPSASHKIRLDGQLVIPGLVDIHAHMREPGYTYKEDFETGSRAAAAGGVTMFVDMPNTHPPTDGLLEFKEKRRMAEQKSVVDFNHFVFPKLSEISRVAGAGAAGFKIFMLKGEYPYDPRVCIDDVGRISEAFHEVSRTGLPCAVHPSDLTKIRELYDDRRRKHPRERKYVSYAKAFTDESVYVTAVSKLLGLASETGVRLHLLHTHSQAVVAIIQRARRQGLRVTSEIDPVFLLTEPADLSRLGPLAVPGGVFAKRRNDSLWRAIRTGSIDVVATDHAPHTSEEIIRMAEEDPFLAPFGTPQLEHYLSAMLTQVHRGFLTLPKLVRVISTNPSKVVGVYPRKGAISVGSDADLVIVDMKRETKISNECLYTKVGWSPYAGKILKGIPIMTLVRGQPVMENGMVVGKMGMGRFVAPLQVRKPKKRPNG